MQAHFIYHHYNASVTACLGNLTCHIRNILCFQTSHNNKWMYNTDFIQVYTVLTFMEQHITNSASSVYVFHNNTATLAATTPEMLLPLKLLSVLDRIFIYSPMLNFYIVARLFWFAFYFCCLIVVFHYR